ncbi:MAG: ABC transporter ATP-binding protein [Chloroflexi bacterium]|nr:ABC transporter ATP-binding protein [Chloroflexota bacterium]
MTQQAAAASASEHHTTLALDTLAWPAHQASEALLCLGQQSGLVATSAETPVLPTLNGVEFSLLSRWIETSALALGLEAEPIQTTYAEAATFVQSVGPALLRLPGADASPRFLALLRSQRGWAYLIAPNRTVQRVRNQVVEAALWTALVKPHSARLEPVLAQIKVPAQRQAQFQQAILGELLGTTTLAAGWLLRLAPSAPLNQQATQAQLLRTLGVLVGSYCGQLLLTLVAWWLIGRGALVGKFTWSWLLAWALVLLTTIPFQLLTTLTQRQLVLRVGELFKVRLLYGALQLQPEEIRHQGAGHFLGRVLAADQVEQLVLAGGFVSLLAVLQVGVAGVLLATTVGGGMSAWLLLGWCLVTLGLSWRYDQANATWTLTQRAMTNDLVERMVGHRTRLVQEDRRHWHDEEDGALERYAQLQAQVDQTASQLASIPRGWLVLGLAGFVYMLLATQPTATQLAIRLGSILFAYQALTSMTVGVRSLANVRSAWREVSTLFQAATRGQQAGGVGNEPVAVMRNADKDNGQPLLHVQAVEFRYKRSDHEQGRRILEHCNLRINAGDRLLLAGPSGGGKSTLAALLAGLRSPSAGLLTLWGHEQQTVDMAAWRQRVVIVPQFHENYVLTGTLAFNLLLGRRWPPTPGDVSEAETLCRELGLGDLLDRMPAGLQQMVGESGWRLSHGERSRLYIARALLQEADLIILDESFGALDPENLQIALQCVRRRAPTLLVIAHP